MIEAGSSALLRVGDKRKMVSVTGVHKIGDAEPEAVIAIEAYDLVWHARCPVARLEPTKIAGNGKRSRPK